MRDDSQSKYEVEVEVCRVEFRSQEPEVRIWSLSTIFWILNTVFWILDYLEHGTLQAMELKG